MTLIYIAPEVAHVRELYPYLAQSAVSALPIRKRIELQAETLYQAHRTGDPRVAMQIMSWWPMAQGKAFADVLAAPFCKADALLTVSCEYGFADWAKVKKLDDLALDPAFERALDLMLAGDTAQLVSLLDENPHLVEARSRFGHAATLLHYLGANGVESHRQLVPLNAADIAQQLIQRGAHKAAQANMYGGGQTPYALASSSAHPVNAGISAELKDALRIDL